MELAQQQVPEGYQQTEIGVFPEEWEITQVSDVSQVIDSLHVTPSFSLDGYAMVRVADIKTGNLNLKTTLKVTEKIFSEFTRNYKPKKADIVLSRVGSYGVSSYVNTDEEFCMGQNTVVIRPKIMSKYLYYMLNSDATWQQIEDGSYGSGYKSLSLRNINDLYLPLPEDEEQIAISNALSDVDELIASLEKLIAKKRDIKTATMQQLLTGKKRLPGFGEGKSTKQTEFGQIPEDWVLQPLGNSFEFKNGLNKEKKYFGYGTPIINYMDVYKHAGLGISNILGKVDVTRDERRAYEARKGDVFFTRTSETVEEIGTACTLLDKVDNAVFSGFVLRARPTDEFFDLYFKKYCFETWIVRKQIMATSSYTTRALTNGRLLSLVKVPAPIDREEQSSIAIVLTNMDEELAVLGKKLQKNKAIKQGMMQELLTGKTRLINPEGGQS